MLIPVLTSISPHIVQACDLSGQVLGVMGSLFFAYDLLGRPGGPLRWILRIVIPGTISTAILFSIALIAIAVLHPTYTVAVSIATILTIFGAILGVFNGIFVAAPGAIRPKSFFSFWDAVVGFVVTAVIYGVIELLSDQFTPPTVADLYSALATACVGTIAASIWRWLNSPRSAPAGKSTARVYRIWPLAILLLVLFGVTAIYLITNQGPPSISVFVSIGIVAGYGVVSCLLWFAGKDEVASGTSDKRPFVYSRQGARIGLLAGFGMVFVVVFAYFALASLVGGLYSLTLVPFAFAACIYAATSSVGGAVSSGLTRYIFWRINLLPERQMQVVGLFCILLAFSTQILGPTAGLLNIPIR